MSMSMCENTVDQIITNFALFELETNSIDISRNINGEETFTEQTICYKINMLHEKSLFFFTHFKAKI